MLIQVADDVLPWVIYLLHTSLTVASEEEARAQGIATGLMSRYTYTCMNANRIVSLYYLPRAFFHHPDLK